VSAIASSGHCFKLLLLQVVVLAKCGMRLGGAVAGARVVVGSRVTVDACLACPYAPRGCATPGRPAASRVRIRSKLSPVPVAGARWRDRFPVPALDKIGLLATMCAPVPSCGQPWALSS